ncbi:hypothetical protein FAM22021_001017 [Propionibacterium freudenreichii]|nr:hypothetical protein [Propionibacterium freudenreichii]
MRNAWEPTRTAGGSSRGGGGDGPGGRDGGAWDPTGRGRCASPASFNGVVGLKATYGRIPATPYRAFGRLAHIGPLTRTVEDAALTLDFFVLGTLPDPATRMP